MICKHRWRNDFQSGGGGRFLKSKLGRRACATQGSVSEGGCAPLWSLSFFENVVLNGVIWCTIFHHVKHLTAYLLYGVFSFRTWESKSGGAIPLSLKSGGATDPPVPPPMFVKKVKLIILLMRQSFFGFHLINCHP